MSALAQVGDSTWVDPAEVASISVPRCGRDHRAKANEPTWVAVVSISLRSGAQFESVMKFDHEVTGPEIAHDLVQRFCLARVTPLPSRVSPLVAELADLAAIAIESLDSINSVAALAAMDGATDLARSLVDAHRRFPA